MAYAEKLNDPRWQIRRLEVLNRDKFTCQLCGDTKTNLQVNHLIYRNEPWDVPIEYLQTLCAHCHYLYHLHKDNRYPEPKKVVKFDQSGYIGVVTVHAISDIGIISTQFQGLENTGNFIGITLDQLSKIIKEMPSALQSVVLPKK